MRNRFNRITTKNNRIFFFATYSLLFVILCMAVFCWHFLSGRTLIWQTDGLPQHYRALVYYAQYLRSMIREWFGSGHISVKEFGFELGEGNDILTTLHYYVIGDPLTLLSVFVPTDKMYLFYNFLSVFRMYLSGLAFSLLCFYVKPETDERGILAGSLSYAFCYWAVHHAARHPFFLAPMIWFPLLILGIEKILREKKPLLFIGAVFLSAVCNFYFFFMLVVLTVIYAFVRIGTAYRFHIRIMAEKMFSLLGYSAIGLCMSAAVFLPVLAAFAGDDRRNAAASLSLLFSKAYYSSVPGMFVSEGTADYLFLGFAAPVLLAVLLLFLRKGHRCLKIYYGICGVFLIFPVFARFLNGMSYAYHRWSWAIALLCAFTLVAVWDDLISPDPKLYRNLWMAFGGYVLLCLLCENSHETKTLIGLSCSALCLLILAPKGLISHSPKVKTCISTALLCVSIFFIGYYTYGPVKDSFTEESIEVSEAREGYRNNETALLRQVAEKGSFYRYSGRNLTQNAGLTESISSTQYYWSLTNASVSGYRREMEMREYLLQEYEGDDDRSIPLLLGDVMYYIAPAGETKGIPYGFTLVAEDEKNAVYQNQETPGLSYFYHSVTSEESWKQMPAIEKQETMLESVYLEGYEGSLDEQDCPKNVYEIAYEIPDKEWETKVQSGTIRVEQADTRIVLALETPVKGELYAEVCGLSYQDPAGKSGIFADNTLSRRGSIRIRDDAGDKKTLLCGSEQYRFYNDRHDFLVNLGISQTDRKEIEIIFNTPGVYSYSDFHIWAQPTDGFSEKIEVLKNDAPEEIQVGEDQVTMKVRASADGILCAAIPFSKGWKAAVDGDETKVYAANVKYIGIEVPAGEHEITLVYQTPYLRLGAVISVIGWLAYIGMIYHERGKRKRL